MRANLLLSTFDRVFFVLVALQIPVQIVVGILELLDSERC